MALQIREGCTFDNDPAGQKAAVEAAAVLPPGKAYIGFLEDYKDASDALMDGQAADIKAVCNFNHESYTDLMGLLKGNHYLTL